MEPSDPPLADIVQESEEHIKHYYLAALEITENFHFGTHH